MNRLKKIMIGFICFIIGCQGAATGLAKESIKEEWVAGLISDYIAKRMSVSPSEIETHLLSDLAEFRKVNGDGVKWSVREANESSLLGRSVFLLIPEDAARRLAPQWITVESEWVHPAIVAVHSIKKNQIIESDDVSLQIIRSGRWLDFFSRENNSPVGKRAVQPIRSGAPITRDLVENPPLFVQGERVILLVEIGNVRVTVPGKALEDGYKGKVISVLNLESRKMVYGEPLDGSTVKISTGRN